jgi:putative sigma-54 modulation protein
MAVKVDVFAKNMEITDHINEYVVKKVSRLDRYLPNIEEARVDLSFIKSARHAADRQVAQITIHGKGYILRVEERADEIFAALDAALEKMQRKIERLKGKRTHGRGDGMSAAQVALEQETIDDETGPLYVIARRKQFTLTPMDENEAIEQMNLLGHDSFFIFYNMDTNSINVLYKRRDGTYGLIDPQIG